jgi:hypothetical protein
MILESCCYMRSWWDIGGHLKKQSMLWILSPFWFGFKISTHDAIISTTNEKKKFVGVAKKGDYKFTYNIQVTKKSQVDYAYCSQMQFIFVACNLLPCDNCIDAYCSQMQLILVTCNLFPSVASTIWHTITQIHFLHN